MKKDYDKWFPQKKLLDLEVGKGEKLRSFKECEVWWCQIGANIGVELIGKGKNFTRPVLIIKKYNKRQFFGALMTSSPNDNGFHFLISKEGEKISKVCLSQLRTFDAKRLSPHDNGSIKTVSVTLFETIKLKIKDSL